MVDAVGVGDQTGDWRLNRSKPAALIIGGGIAGIQAALDIADAGYPVYLVEREPSIGGRMAQLDKTFPTLDCSSCILTPKMVDVGNHPNVELMTSESASRRVSERFASKCVRNRATWTSKNAQAAARARKPVG
jgi:heterodisulfide reductase subunit A-like polyferredoxin